jgi:hypothetical protein
MPRDPGDQSGWNEFFRESLAETEEHLLELEAAHAALALRLVKLIAEVGGMSDDATITACLLGHAEEVLRLNLRMGQWDWKSRLAQRVEDAARHLHAMPRPLGRDFGPRPRRVVWGGRSETK